MAAATRSDVEELLRKLKNGTPQPFLNWQMLAVVASVIVAGATGAIQIGAVQTHTSDTIERVNNIDMLQRDVRDRLSKLESVIQEQNRRLSSIDQHDQQTLDARAKITGDIATLRANQDENLRRIADYERAAQRLRDRINEQFKDAAAKADVVEATNTLKAVFEAELRRIDEEVRDLRSNRAPVENQSGRR